MCGRYTIIAKAVEIEKRFNIEVPELYTPRYNAAPTQILPVITNKQPEGLSFFQWGLVPSWSKDTRIGAKMINARAETLHEKPSFKNALNKRRCLVLADSFYEWKKATKKSKIPYRILLKSKELFAFAGLWEEYKVENEEVLHTFTIITTQANSTISSIHERMPVILEKDKENQWLDTTLSTEELRSMLLPMPSDMVKFHTVAPLVNNVANDNAQLIEPTEATDQFGNFTLFD